MAKHKKNIKNKNKILFFIMIVILLILILGGILIGDFIGRKISNLNIKNIDKEDVAINNQLYNTISDSITQNEFKNIKTIALFGIDTMSAGDGQEEEGFKGRSDTIIILSVNREKKTIKMISIPRDTYVEIEGHGKDKINYAYAFDGPQLAVKTINQNFGLNITEYVTIDFAELVNIINAIGGINIELSKDEVDYINKNSVIPYGISGNKQKKLVSYGNVTLDGEQALTHSRNRTIGDDFTRTGRQRKVLEAIFSKISKMSAGEIDKLVDIILKQVTTNINIIENLGLLGEIILNKDIYLSCITSAQVPTREYAKDQYINGIYYFVVNDPQLLKEKMIDYIYIK